MRDRQASTTRHPRPSLLIPRPRETTPPNLPHKLKQRVHDQTRAVAAPDTLVYSNPIGRRISHDMVGPYTISHDLPRSPTTWSAHRSTAHCPAAFLALSAAKISLCPCISHDLSLSRCVLVVLDALRPHCLHQRGGRLGGCRHRCSQCSRSRRPQAPHQTQPWALARSLAARMKAINEMGISCAPF